MGCRGRCGTGNVRARRCLRVRPSSPSRLPERSLTPRPTALAQDYGRYVQLPLCCESRMLPDAETLRERMLALAYEEGMPDGVEARSAALVQGAVEVRSPLSLSPFSAMARY